MKALLSTIAFCLGFGFTVASAEEPVEDPVPPAESASPVIDTTNLEGAEALDGVEAGEDGPAFDKPNLFGSIAAIAPGLVVHGAGHWAAGDRSTGYKLALAQLTGAAFAVGGISLLAVTGADPYFTPPGALLLQYGVGLFAGTFLVDLFGVAAPEGGFGSPVSRASWLDLRTGYRYSYDRIFEERRHAATIGADYRVGWFGLEGFAAGVGPSGDAEAGLDTRFRLTGPRPDRQSQDGSYSDLVVGYDYRTWTRGRFSTHTVDLFWDNRWDLIRLAPSLDGSFVVIGAGIGFQTFARRELPDDTTTLLLSRMGLGLDLGEADDGWGELLTYYDHRHDGPTGGLKVTGLGSGTAGHFGARWNQHVWNGWGFYVESSIGSAWVSSIGLEHRLGGRR